MTGGLGLSGFASQQITDQPLPGAGYNVALGAKGKLFGGELGLNGGGYSFDGESLSDITTLGVSADLKLQPSIAFFEPYALIGIGGYAMNDAVIEETVGGGAIRLGVGADFRFNDFALRASYLHSSYAFGDETGAYGGDLSARSETLSANLVVYF